MKRKISIDIDPSLLQRLDDFARASGISRNAALAMAAARLLNERK
ncbi:CopG family transcriptional regulator [Burkholderia sp. Bp9099]|nr:CopG family transcriptional regulator [Burkholderia sp. Bp9099]